MGKFGPPGGDLVPFSARGGYPPRRPPKPLYPILSSACPKKIFRHYVAKTFHTPPPLFKQGDLDGGRRFSIPYPETPSLAAFAVCSATAAIFLQFWMQMMRGEGWMCADFRSPTSRSHRNYITCRVRSMFCDRGNFFANLDADDDGGGGCAPIFDHLPHVHTETTSLAAFVACSATAAIFLPTWVKYCHANCHCILGVLYAN